MGKKSRKKLNRVNPFIERLKDLSFTSDFRAAEDNTSKLEWDLAFPPEDKTMSEYFIPSLWTSLGTSLDIYKQVLPMGQPSLPALAHQIAKMYEILLEDYPNDFLWQYTNSGSYGYCGHDFWEGQCIKIHISIRGHFNVNFRYLTFFHEMGHALDPNFKIEDNRTPYEKEIIAWNIGLSLAEKYGVTFDAVTIALGQAALDSYPQGKLNHYELRHWSRVDVPETSMVQNRLNYEMTGIQEVCA